MMGRRGRGRRLGGDRTLTGEVSIAEVSGYCVNIHDGVEVRKKDLIVLRGVGERKSKYLMER